MKQIFFALVSAVLLNFYAHAADFSSLIDHMKSEIAFEKNNYQVLKGSDKFRDLRKGKSETYENFETDIAKTVELLHKIENYKGDAQHANVVLTKAFGLRFIQITRANNDYLKGLMRSLKERAVKSTYWSINNTKIASLKAGESVSAQWNHIIGQTSLDRFQLLSDVIKEILLHMKRNQLPLTVLNQTWLRCARTLHPYLAGKVEILEQLEQSIGVNVDEAYDIGMATEFSLCSYYLVPQHEVSFPCKTLGTPANKLESRCYVTEQEYNSLPVAFKRTLPKQKPEFDRDPEQPKFEFPDALKLFQQDVLVVVPPEQAIESSTVESPMNDQPTSTIVAMLRDEIGGEEITRAACEEPKLACLAQNDENNVPIVNKHVDDVLL